MRMIFQAASWGLIALLRERRCAIRGRPSATPPLEWIDAATGHRVIRLSTEAGTRSMYFHQNSITPDGRYVITEGTAGIVAIEIATRKNTLIVPGKVRALFVGRKSGLVYFSRSEGAGDSEQRTATTIFTVPATGGEPRRIAQIDRGFIGSVNADETLLLGVYAERAYQLEQGPRDPRFDANYAATGKDGKPLTFAEAKEVRLLQREQARIPMAMFTVNTATGEQKIIHQSTDWLNHLQFSPTDPQELIFCHEGPWHRVDRVWAMKLGGKPRLVHRRTMNMEIAGHEFFDVDGKTIWYDLQTPRGEVFWLASAAPDGTRRWYHVDRDHWSVHFQISPDGKTVRRRRRRRGNGGAREGRQVAVPVHAAGDSGRRGDLGAECRRPRASRNAARRTAGRHEEARLPPGAEHHLHARRQVAHLPLEHARRRAHLHGGAGRKAGS